MARIKEAYLWLIARNRSHLSVLELLFDIAHNLATVQAREGTTHQLGVYSRGTDDRACQCAERRRCEVEDSLDLSERGKRIRGC